MPWRRSFNRTSVPHDPSVWFLELFILEPDETLDAMWVGVEHHMGYWGPELVDPQGGAVLMHGLVLTPPPPASVPAPLSDPFERWFLRTMAQFQTDTVLWSTADGMVGRHVSLHPDERFQGRHTNVSGDNEHMFLSMQLDPRSATTEWRENLHTLVHVEAFVLD